MSTALKRVLVVCCGVALALCLAGCESQKPAGKYDGMDAAQIIEQLKTDGLPISDTQSYSEDNDPNGLLGRPGKYTSKADFIDSRASATYSLGKTQFDGSMNTDLGGTVEVFPGEKECTDRKDYLSKVTGASGIGEMYTYQMGNILLRVSYDLTPDQATEYEKALNS